MGLLAEICSWTAMFFIVPMLIGVGFAMVSLAPPEYTAAKWCFALATVALSARVGASIIAAELSLIGKISIAFVALGAIGACGIYLVDIVQQREIIKTVNAPVSSPVTEAPKIIDRSAVHIFLAHAYGYRGATSASKREEDMHRHISSEEPFVINSNKLNFAFGVDSTNQTPLRHARITFKYHSQIPLSITRTHTTEPGHFWQEYTPGAQYFYDFGLINGGWAHSWGALGIAFPQAGEYRFDLELASEEIPAIDPIKTYLRVIVNDSAFHKNDKSKQ